MNTTAPERVAKTTPSTGEAGKVKKFPDIGLASFFTYRPTATGFEVFPEPKKVSKGKVDRQVVALGNVPLPAGVPAPARALTLLYGFRDALDEMKDQYAIAKTKGHSLVKIEFKLQVGTNDADTKIIMGTASLEDLPKSRFLNVLRLNQDLQQMLLDGVNELLQVEANKSKRAALFYDRIVEAGARPDLICDVIRKQPIFKHLNSVVYSVPDGTPRGRKVCSIFETDSVIEVTVRGDAPFDIELPKL